MATVPFHSWISTATQDNPGVDPKQLTDYYRQTYGGGPTEDDYAQWERTAREDNPNVAPEELRGYYTQTYGEPAAGAGDVSTALSDFWSEHKGLAGGVKGLAAANLGLDDARDSGFQSYQDNMAEVQARHRPQYELDYLTEQGTAGDWVDAVQYHGTKGVLSLAAGLGMGGVGGLIGKTAAKQGVKAGLKSATGTAAREAAEQTVQRGGKAGFYSGLGGYVAGTSGGEVYGAAGEEALRRDGTLDGVNLPRVNTAAVLHGGVEFASDVALLGLGRLLPGGAGADLLKGLSTPARVGAAGAIGAGTEGAEEATQTGIEYWGAEKELGTPEMWRDVRQGAFAGAIGGGMAGSVVGAVSGRGQLPPPQEPQDPGVPPIPARTPAAIPDGWHEPTNLLSALGETGSPRQANKRLEALGLQTYDAEAKRWVPTELGAAFAQPHDWAVGGRTGTNLIWDVAKIQEHLANQPPPPPAPEKPLSKRAQKAQARQATLDQALSLFDGDQNLQARVRDPRRAADIVAFRQELDALGDGPEALAAVQEMAEAQSSKSSVTSELRLSLANKRLAELAASAPPTVTTRDTTDILAGTTTDAISAPPPRQEDLARWGRAGETQAPETPVPLAPTAGLPDVVAAVRTALMDAKGITPAQRETLGLWLNTPDGSDATFANIGERLGVSKQAANKRVLTALSTLRQHPAVKAFAPQIRGILSQARAPRVTDEAAPTADNLAALASQNGMDQLDPRNIATTGGQLVDTADLAEGGNLTPSTTKTQIGLTDENAVDRQASAFLALHPAVQQGVADHLDVPLGTPTFRPTPTQVEQAEEGELVFAQNGDPQTVGAAWARLPPEKKARFNKLVGLGLDRNAIRTMVKILSEETLNAEQLPAPETSIAPQDRQLVGRDESVGANAPASLPDPGRGGVSQESLGRDAESEPSPDLQRDLNNTSFGEAPAQSQPTTREAFTKILTDLTGRASNWRITLHDTVDQAVQAGVPEANLRGTSGRGAYGWVETKNGKTHATFILERVQAGQELSAILHELGVHVGLEGMLDQAQIDRLFWQIVKWGDAGDQSQEARIAVRAMARIAQAETPDMQLKSEAIAYFIEEAVRAGVNPTAMAHKTALDRWFRTLWAAFKVALRKLGVRNIDGLKAQHLVDLAYGAARLELAGKWHGAAAKFRTFDHKYMGSGEGAQAYGWGSYFASREGIARSYMDADVKRKAAEEERPPITSMLFVGNAPASNMMAGVVDPTERPDTAAITELVARINKRARPGLDLGPHIDYVLEDLAANSYTQDAAEWLRANRDKLSFRYRGVNKGSLFRVDNAVSPENTMHWDKPLSEQPQAVQEALKASEYVTDPYFNRFQDAVNAGVAGSAIYSGLEEHLGSDKAASEYLDSIGIKAMEHFDAPSRSKWKSGKTDNLSTNLVVFNDQNILTIGRAPGSDLSQIRYGEPSWAPPAQIQKAIDKLPTPLQDPVANLVDSVRTAANKTHLGLAFTKDLADHIRSKAAPFRPAIDRYMAGVTAAKIERITRDGVVSDILQRYHTLKLETLQKQAATYLADSRVKGKWGYDPQEVTDANPEAWQPPGYDANETVKVDPAMAEAFGRLPTAVQRVVVDVNKLLAENFKTTQALIEQKINQVYDKRLAQLNEQLAAETDPKKVDKLTKKVATTKADQANALKAYGKKMVLTKAPYAPLKREGNYVVQAFSPELKALFDKGDGRTSEERKRYDALRRDETHYTLEFVANRSEARKRMAALTQTFGENVDSWEKTSWRDKTYVGLPEVDRLRALVVEGVGEPGNARLTRDVENLALQIMANTHARQSQHHAKLLPGYDPDMMRAFVSQARADAHNIANLMHLDEINDAIQTMTRMVEDPKVRAQTSVDRDTLGRMISELHRRWGDTLRYEPSPLIDRLAAVSSTWHLLLSPAYYFQNATQVGMMSVPWMAGTHGWVKTQQAVLAAYRDILPMIKDKAASWEHFDTKLVPADVVEVIAKLQASGQINIFMDLELGQAATTSTTLAGQAGRTFDQTIRRLPAKMETINRVVTAIAAYRLASAPGPKQLSTAQATEYAGKVIDITHGDYDGFNAPRWISPGVWGPSAKLLFQFRKFQLIQIAFYARMFNDMTAGHPPEVRRAAGKALLFSVSHTVAAAGLMGFPALGLIQIMASLFGDDDEPNDKDAQDFKIRQAMLDGGMPSDMIDLVLGGLPALMSIDMTGKLGSQNLLTLYPYAKVDPQERGNFEKLATTALGPTAGMVGKMYRGFGDLQRGDYYAGLEKLFGAGVGDAVQAARLATKGERTYNADQAFSPEELGLATAIVAGLGFQPEILSKRWTKQRVVQSYEKTFEARTAEIKRAFNAATKDGDRKTVRGLRTEWMRLQSAKRAAGFQPAPMADLTRSPAAQAKRERQTLGGVKYDRGNRGAVERADRVFN